MHHVITLGGVGMGGRAKAVHQKAELSNTDYQPGHSYEVALAGRQNRVYRKLLTELGFECKMVSTNPNTGNRIEGWFKSVQ
jgi:hypothetical protein